MGYLAIGIAIPLMTIGIIVAWVFAGRRVRTWMRALLDQEVAAGTIKPEELDVLSGPHRGRRKYLKAIKQQAGKAASKRAAWILEAEIHLAAAIAATQDEHSAAAEEARNEVARLRVLSTS